MKPDPTRDYISDSERARAARTRGRSAALADMEAADLAERNATEHRARVNRLLAWSWQCVQMHGGWPAILAFNLTVASAAADRDWPVLA